ncbi:MAG: cation:proton antiporter, partial [Ruminiclostridium sp.]|nr:cation:proton antiporter [Ruminiclostridium sp.]
MHYKYLLDIALILLFTKFLGLIFQRLHMPQVVGSLIAGLLLGPAVLHLVVETAFLETTASLGVILLMFIAGLETDINELKSCGKAATIIAVAGVLVPLAGGYLVGTYFFPNALSIENIFLGIVLTATSVSITVETLREMGKLRGPVGSAILGAAIIDD